MLKTKENVVLKILLERTAKAQLEISGLVEARSGSRAAATSKMELPAVNYYHKELQLHYCSGPRSAFESIVLCNQFECSA